MRNTSAFEFTRLARMLAAAARQRGLVAPGFRTPPHEPGRLRGVRRYPDGTVVVSVSTSRPTSLVIDDMIEGVLVANDLTGDAKNTLRSALRDEIGVGIVRAA